MKRRAFELTDIAKNIDLVTLNDSLLRVAAMPEAERNALGRKIIDQQRAEVKAAAIAEAVAKANADAEARTAEIDKNSNTPKVGAAAIGDAGAVDKFWAYDETPTP